MRIMGFALALAAASPALAQQAGSAPAPVPVATDPARLAAAQRTIDMVWPIGTLKRVMKTNMDAVMDMAMSSTLGMSAGTLANMGGAELPAGQKDESLGELAVKADPHFKERFRITMGVMSDGMSAVMTGMEPEMRAAMAGAYARRFTTAELNDMNAFFATPSGRRYASESVTIMQDAELMRAMQALHPRLMGAMPGIIDKVKTATAHLPPAPAPADTEEQEQ